jgi:hypothetical protein
VSGPPETTPHTPTPPEFPPTPFFSLRNVPFWFCLALIAAVAGLIWQAP